jgi:hypothetical protein
MISLTKGGNRRKPSFSTICDWISKAWKEITVQTIQNGFKKAGIQYYDQRLQQETTQDEEIETISDTDNGEDAENTAIVIDDDSDDELLGDLFDGFEELHLEDD